MLRIIGLCLTLIAAICPPAVSAPVTYSFTGVITEVFGDGAVAPAAIGDSIPIAITVEQQSSPSYYYQTPNLTYFSCGDPCEKAVILDTTFAGISIAGEFGGVKIDLGYFLRFSAGNFINVEPSCNIRGCERYSYRLFELDLLDYSLSGTAGLAGLDHLPTSIDPTLFTGGAFTVFQSFTYSEDIYGYGYVTQDVGYRGYIELTPIPEPASLALLTAGVIGIGISRRTRTSSAHGTTGPHFTPRP